MMPLLCLCDKNVAKGEARNRVMGLMAERKILALLRSLGCCFLAVLVVPVHAAAQTVSTEPVPTIRTTSQLVVLDVVATNAQQNPIHHLTSSDFTILEDDHPQKIKMFEEHTADTPALAPPKPKPKGQLTRLGRG